MNVGIVAEYNPFHKGHKLHIEITKQKTGAENVIALMSGSFVQRGEPAIYSKFVRTKTALLNGVDMVIELPVEYATGSADIFCRGAVDILDKSRIVDILSFGTELGELSPFIEGAKLLLDEPVSFKKALHKELNCGKPYASARLTALSEVMSRDMSFLSTPNNILAFEYIRALFALNSSIKPFTVKRQANDYNSQQMSGEISSASAIRESIYRGDIANALYATPKNCRFIFESTENFIDRYTDIFKYIMLSKSPSELQEIDGVAEGIENRILSSLNCGSLTEIAQAVKSKRYALSRVRRTLLHILLSITKEDALKAPQYIRVLGFKRSKSQLVSELAKKASLPVITNVKNAPEGLLKKEIFATDMYFLPLDSGRGKDFTDFPIILD